MSEWRTLRSFASLEEAQAAQSFLEGEGLKAFIPTQHASAILPHFTVGLGGVELQVEDEDFERARSLLAETEDSGIGIPQSPQVETGMQLAKKASWLGVAGFFFFPVVLNLYSLYLFSLAHRRGFRFRQAGAIAYLGMFFNFLGIVIVPLYFFTKA